MNATSPTEYTFMTDSFNFSDDEKYLGVLSKDGFVDVMVLITICITGIVGNSLVIIVYSVTTQKETTASLYMIHLAIADLFTLLAVVTLHVSQYFPQTWQVLWRYDFQCKLHRFGRFLATVTTVYIMVAIALDRYVAVIHPLVYRVHNSPKRTKRILACIWIGSALLASPVSFRFTTKYNADFKASAFQSDACQLERSPNYQIFFRFYVCFILVLIPAIATGLVYSLLLIQVCRRNKDFLNGQHSQLAALSYLNQWKIAKTLFAVYIGYMVCYIPYFMFNFASVFDYYFSYIFSNVALLLPFANSCVNPVFYTLLNDKFRAGLLDIFLPAGREGRRNADTTKMNVVSHVQSCPTSSRSTQTLHSMV
ncbi:Somatostatin receptor type 4 [Holothuria leucospilota]|uniref:Somatostatin receptor type 4 n=1 Tax=Holothuria leucospilota TaxID=206669 RepID=A0A9Q1BZQ7_HOLLE|nr:Somatostatin receptor type 4 [Holothuria leucospilota]